MFCARSCSSRCQVRLLRTTTHGYCQIWARNQKTKTHEQLSKNPRRQKESWTKIVCLNQSVHHVFCALVIVETVRVGVADFPKWQRARKDALRSCQMYRGLCFLFSQTGDVPLGSISSLARFGAKTQANTQDSKQVRMQASKPMALANHDHKPPTHPEL